MGMHRLVYHILCDVRIELERIRQAGITEHESFEPLSEESLLQLLIQIQHKKLRQIPLHKNDPEQFKIGRDVIRIEIRIRKAVLPGPRREQIQTSIENYYATLVNGDEAPIIHTSRDDLKQHARILIELLKKPKQQ